MTDKFSMRIGRITCELPSNKVIYMCRVVGSGCECDTVADEANETAAKMQAARI